ncbi:hypothetical protein PINS_up021273 [Pythium insidiosum]|nr:hypothetical protein PINS_up021273 [Pythium insidiosum]
MYHQVTLWDFAGQDIYKPAHAPFFSEKTLFMLCIDLYAYKFKINEALTHHQAQRVKIMKHYAEANVLCWLRLIFFRQPKARVVLVGTKSDLVEKREIDVVWKEVDVQIQTWKNAFKRDIDVETMGILPCEAQEVSGYLEGFVHPEKLAVNSVKPDDIEPMIEEIQKIVASNEVSPLLSEVIDALGEVHRRRLEVNNQGDKDKVEKLIIPKSDLDSSPAALEELHNLGDVILIKDDSCEAYNESVILEPKLIVDFIRQIVSHELIDPNDAGKDPITVGALQQIRKDGTVPHKFLAQLPLWRDCDDDLRIVIKTLLHRFQLIYPEVDVDMASNPDIIVPLLWQHNGDVALPPLSKEIALTQLNPPPDAPYPTQVCWEYEFKQGIPPTLFTHLAVAAHVPGVKPSVHEGCIDMQDQKGKAFISRISIPMDKMLGVHSNFVRLEVIAFGVRDAWEKLKFFIYAMERVLDKYPGLTPVRYVEVRPPGGGVERHNVNLDVARMKKAKETRSECEEDTVKWLPPLTIGMDWFVEKHWREADHNKTMKKISEVTMKLDQLKQLGEHSESYLRAILRLSLQPEHDRKFPGLWALEKLQPEQGNPILRIWFYSDLTGICHQKEPIEIRIPNDTLAKYGECIKFGLSIVSNLVPSALDFGVLKIAVNHATSVLNDRVDRALKIHSLIANFDFREQTGDRSVLSSTLQATERKDETTDDSLSGLDQGQAMRLLEELLQLANITAESIPSLSGLRQGVTIENGHVWASEDELVKQDGVLEVYTGKSTTFDSSSVSRKDNQHQDDPSTGNCAIQVSVIHVPRKFRESVKFSMALTFKEQESHPCQQHLHPVSDRKLPDWNGRVARHNMKTTVDQIHDCELQFQPYKKLVFGIRKKIGQSSSFTFPHNHKVGHTESWTIEWKDGDAEEYFELKVESVTSENNP